ncbi:cadherin domain-containing protein [Fibrobacter sp.]|uniref:cadherin repeat domain-containing protein n=1 Tax=Fibrobacter sp. TaxID=35828 RepID=UPI00386B51F6
MIANKIVIGNEIRGDEAFRYVPVFPPKLATASAMGGFVENNTTTVIPIKLSAETKNGASFKYCFDLSKSTAELADFNVYPNKDKDGNYYPKFPVCGTSSGDVVIPRNAKEPEEKVYLNVFLDDDGDEPTEILKMKIYDLNGAVLPKGSDGLFDLNILNVPLFDFGDVEKEYKIAENSVSPNDTVAKIPIEGQDFTDFVIEMVDKAGSDEHPVKLNDLFNIAINETEKFVAITVAKHDELDYESDRIKLEYLVTLSLKDKGGVEGCKTVTAQTTLKITDVNEPPYFVEFGPYTIPENSEVGTKVDPNRAHAEDPDKDVAFNTLVYSIPVNEDADKTNDVPFTIHPQTGVITVADKSKLDYETHSLPYVFNVEVFDNLNKVPQEVEIYILDVNEPPVIIDTTGDTIRVAENSTIGLAMAYFEVTDPDADDMANLLTQIVPTITDNNKKTGKKSAEDLFKMVMEKTKDVSGVDKYWAVLKVKDELDFEAIMAAHGDSVFDVTLTFTDQAGAGLDTMIAKKIAVTDVNEKPYFTDVGPFDVKENSEVGTFVGEVIAADDDIKPKFNTLYYTIPVNEDDDPDNDVPFAIVDKKSGKITVANKEALDFEDPSILDHKFEFLVQVTDGEFPITTPVIITLSDDDEPPHIIPECEGEKCIEICKGDKCEVCEGESCHETCIDHCDEPRNPAKVLTVTVDENSPTGFEIINYAVSDEDLLVNHTKLEVTFDNTNNSDAKSLFVAEMKKVSGQWRLIISVNDGSALDYEKIKETHELTIYVRDPDDREGLRDSLLRIIKVVDVNEDPVITGVEDLNNDIKAADKDDYTFYPKEDLAAGGSVGYVHTYDPDTLHKDEFGYREFTLDNPNNYPFEMKDSLLVLTKKLDYENDSKVYKFDVIVNNCERAKNSAGKYEKVNPPKCAEPAKQTVFVKIQDVPEPPHIIPECEGDKCIEICKDDNCEVCSGETCHETCTENCDEPRNPAKVLTVTVNENSPTGYEIINYAVSDEDLLVNHTKLEATFSNTNNSDAKSLFVAEMKKVSGEWRLIVSVKDSSKLDYEKIKETHELTIYVSDPDDPDGMYDSLLRIIKVVDVNEAPIADDAKFEPDENLPDSAVIGELKVVELDTKHVKEFGHLEYSIIGKDETFVFAMDSNRVIVNDPSKMDYELPVHNYTFDVLVKNCEWNKTSGRYDGECLYDTANVVVNIQDVNEKPEIIIDGPTPDGGDDSEPFCVAHCDTTDRGVWKDSILTVGVKENTDDSLLSKTGMVLFQYHYVDEDTGHVAGAKVTWFDAGSTISSVSTKGSDLFNIEGKNGVITVTVKDQKLLDYEKLRNATSRDDPDPEYTMGIVVTDPKGLKDTLYRIIRVVDVNEKPLYTAEPCVVVEGNHPGDSIGHVEHPSDIDSLSRNPALYDNDFKMTGGDTTRFELRKDSTDLMRVMLAALDSIDCEDGSYICGVDSVYWVELTYGDTSLKTVYNNIRIPVKVLDLNEPPEFRTDTIGVAENSPKGTVVDTIKWFDWDRFDTTMHFEISNDPSGCFDIDEKTGVVTVKKDNCADLNYEKNPTLKIEVAITDMVDVTDRSLISGGPNTVKKIITVNVHDVNEPPSITDKTITVKEDTKKGSVVDTVRATDPDIVPEYTDLTYTLIGGDTATFKIEPKTGALILKDTLDYEAKSSYYVTVRVDDGEFADTAKVKINIGNVKEWTKVKIIEAESKRKDWENPDVIYINEPINKLCWVQDGDSLCKEGLKIAKDTTIIVEWRNPTKDYAGRDTLRIYYSNSIPSVTVTGKKTLVDADNVFTIVEDMGEADTNIYVNKSKDSIWVKIKDPASKLDTAIGIEVSLGPVEASKIQGSLDKMTKVADSKIMRDETAKNVVETLVNRNQYKYTYKEIVGKDTVKVSYMTDKDGEPIKVPVINEKGKVDSVEVITVTYTTTIDGKEVEVSYQADALTGEVFVKGPAGELMEQGASKKIYGSGKNSKSGNSVTEGMFTITTGGKDILGNDRVISYAVDKNGKMVKNTEGDVGYSVTYSYMNKYGNVATESVFIVVDQVGPKVEIISPVDKEVVRSNSVKVVWTVDGVEQDTLNLQGLSKGPNVIVRFYRDKAGNEDSAVVYVYMKDSKDVDISIEQPVTEISKDKIDEYYAVNPPEKGETFAVSIRNPTTGDEVETLIGGSFKTKEGSGKEPYPGVSGSSKHLGPTLALDIKVPVIDGVAGLATLDDLITPDGLIALERTDAKKAHKITVEEYVAEFCEDGFKIPSDVSQVNLFDTKLKAQIWVYTSLGNFVDYFSFTQELNDPSYTDEAGLLKMYFEMKPDKDGFVKADNGKQYATGAFVYKVQATIHSKARCTIPDNTYNPDNKKNCNAKERDCDGYGETTKRKGDNIKNSDELLKSFGYRRPKHK